ncbi:MAG: tRNA pseudouridine(55) synthase TruB [Bacteroidetes bacterium RIFCSPHIGHO2_02_FULL_44_7]|nr:MAG: tRNA pseudouridine(55) synthase TruB [Bacteroidetes bacterium RIFCSPHIGHO2_02_FULL_44_7]
MRQRLGVKKIKVGHAGTLDPLASGLLVLCIGKDTKKIDSYMIGTKLYTGTILLGKTTPSYDLETEFDASFPTDHIGEKELEAVRRTFLGDQDQVPPMFSAKQIEGQRAYDIARAGGQVEMKANRIQVQRFEIDATDFPAIRFEIACSKGTYIRSIAYDFGARLHSGATLVELRRTRSGDFDIRDAKSVDEWIEIIDSTAI